MTQFSSRPPFNGDPEPWVTNEPEPMRFGAELTPRRGDRFAPRPEFSRAQTNPTNPLLAAFREADADEQKAWVSWLLWEYTESPRKDDYCPAQFEHCKRVLRRRAALMQEAVPA